jgi:hypothetical protein
MEVLNPLTNRMVRVGSHTHGRLVRRGIIAGPGEEKVEPRVEKRGRKPFTIEEKTAKEIERENNRDIEKEKLTRKLAKLNKTKKLKEESEYEADSEYDEIEEEKKGRKVRNAIIDTSVDIIKENKSQFKKVAKSQEDCDDLLKRLLYKKLVSDKKAKQKLKEIDFDSDDEKPKKKKETKDEVSDIEIDDTYISRYFQ